jgi:hypothetical protein
MKGMLILIGFILLLSYMPGLTMRMEYLRLLREARKLLSEDSVPDWPETLARWERNARFAPWIVLRLLARTTRKRLGGMGSLGDVTIMHDHKSEPRQAADKRFREIVGRLYTVTKRIGG